MTEYIEREKAIKALKDNVTEMECHIYFGSNLGVPKDEIEDIVNEIPAADVEPVKHGHWKHVAGMNSKCSECDRYFPVSEFDKRPFDVNYCPNCGAKMDGESDD